MPELVASATGFDRQALPSSLERQLLQPMSMESLIVKIDIAAISDWGSFHSAFQAAFSFPDFYGRNMNAWIDCMGHVDDPSTGMTGISAKPGQLVVLRIDEAADFERRCPEIYRALIECSAIVNSRRIEAGDQPMLTLLLSGR